MATAPASFIYSCEHATDGDIASSDISDEKSDDVIPDSDHAGPMDEN